MNLIHTGLRALQFLWILLITALIGNVIASAFAGNPSVINYSIFVAVFCWIVLIYGLLAAFMESLFIPVVLLAMDGLALLFTLCAGIALAAELGVHSCSNKGYLLSNKLTNGAVNQGKRCHELQASCAFFWFLFATFCASFAMSAVGARGGGMTSSGGGMRRGGPSMSQV